MLESTTTSRVFFAPLGQYHAARVIQSSAEEGEELGLRVIYDERRETNPFFLTTGLFWGGMLAVSMIDFFHEVLRVPPEGRFVQEAPAEVWVVAWKAAGLAGGISLYAGLLLRSVATRIAADEHGITELRCSGGDRHLLKWADVRSWRVESFEDADCDGCGNCCTFTRTRLVVDLESTEKPFVVEHAWQTAVVAELDGAVPMLRSADAEPNAAADGGA